MYPQSHDMTIEQPRAGGFRVRIAIPYSVAPAGNGARGASVRS
jgi:hypothetical protein